MNLNSGAKKKMSTKTKKNFEKLPFRRPKRGNFARKNGPLMESYSLTHLQSKSCENLCEIEYQSKKNPAPKQKFSKKCNFGGEIDGIWPKKDKPLTESCSLTHFQSKSCTNFCEFKFQQKIKRGPKQKFSKKCYFGGRKNGIWPKNDESMESCSLTHF